MTDYYSTLGVDRSASADEIKRAYRRMANQHHPDKGGDTQKFQQIQEAYETLGDAQKKAQYDTPQHQHHQEFGGFAGGHPFHDFFAHFGGGFGPFGDVFGQRGPRNRTINLETVITLEDAHSGKELIASVTLPNGKDQIINVKIPAGIQHGTTLRLAGMGEDNIPGAPKGDIHLTVKIADHPKFRREGDDLITEVVMPVWSAILGDKILVETIDKKQLEMTIPAGTQFDQVLAVQGAGMPNMSDNRFKGRMLVKIKMTIPNNLTEDQKINIKKLIS
jgi:DnaJ-class molecular chaperone